MRIIRNELEKVQPHILHYKHILLANLQTLVWYDESRSLGTSGKIRLSVHTGSEHTPRITTAGYHRQLSDADAYAASDHPIVLRKKNCICQTGSVGVLAHITK